MSKLSRNISIIVLICILLTASMLMINVNVNAYTYNNTDPWKIYGLEEAQGDRKLIDVDTATKCIVVEPKDYIIGEGSGGYVSILAQPNVFCVQKGIDLDGYPEYTIGNKVEITDHTLEYIIGQKKMSEGLIDHDDDPVQHALWMYLNDAKKSPSSDVKNILDDGKQGLITCGNSDATGELKTQAEKIYEDAKNYANYAGKNMTISITADTNTPGKWNISVANASRYDVYVGEVNKGQITEITNVTSTITVKVIAYQDNYTGSYRILKTTDDQRIIVASASKTTEDDDEETPLTPPNTDISLQKYIVAVKKADGSDRDITKVGENGSRANKLAAADGYIVNTSYNHNGKDISNHSGHAEVHADYNKADYYKSEYPVEICEGDTVTYRIYVYNNSDVDATSVIIRDSNKRNKSHIT